MWKKFNLTSSKIELDGLTVARVKIDGYLDSSTFPRLREHLDQLIQEQQYNCLLDLKDLDYISSAGLGVLMQMLRQVRENNGDLKIVNMSEKIERVFNLLGFSRLMKIYDSEEGALAAFAEGRSSSSPAT